MTITYNAILGKKEDLQSNCLAMIASGFNFCSEIEINGTTYLFGERYSARPTSDQKEDAKSTRNEMIRLLKGKEVDGLHVKTFIPEQQW